MVHISTSKVHISTFWKGTTLFLLIHSKFHSLYQHLHCFRLIEVCNSTRRSEFACQVNIFFGNIHGWLMRLGRLIHLVFKGSLWCHRRVTSPCLRFLLVGVTVVKQVPICLLCLVVLTGDMTFVSVRGSVFKSLPAILAKYSKSQSVAKYCCFYSTPPHLG